MKGRLQAVRALGISVVLGAATGCANTAKLQSDVDRLSSSLNDLRSTQAEQLSDLSSLKSEVQQLSGRLDELEHNTKTGLGTDLNTVREDLNSIKGRIPPPAIVPSEALEDDLSRSSELPSEIAPRFESALQNIREGKFSIAKGVLEENLDAVYGTPDAPMVLFWLGMSEEGLNQNPNAVKHYAELITRYSKHRRVPLALLRQASVLIRLGDKKTAHLTFRKLIADFPKSSEAARAKERLKE